VALERSASVRVAKSRTEALPTALFSFALLKLLVARLAPFNLALLKSAPLKLRLSSLR
jgi:hypothetical protein